MNFKLNQMINSYLITVFIRFGINIYFLIFEKYLIRGITGKNHKLNV